MNQLVTRDSPNHNLDTGGAAAGAGNATLIVLRVSAFVARSKGHKIGFILPADKHNFVPLLTLSRSTAGEIQAPLVVVRNNPFSQNNIHRQNHHWRSTNLCNNSK